MITPAIKRGDSRYWMGLTPIVVSASICSVTRMLPSSAAIALPARAVTIRAVNTGLISRVREIATTEPTIDAVLRPGDALYLPRGFVHSAEALGDVSAHLTVGIHVVTRHALVEALLERLGDLQRAIQVDVLSALSLTVGFNDNDGD